MSEFIDPRFRENKPKRSYSVIENERFGLVFAKTVSIISGTDPSKDTFNEPASSSYPIDPMSTLYGINEQEQSWNF